MGNQETLATLDIPDTGRRHTQKEKKKKRNNKPLHLRNMSLDIYALMLPIYQN
jgi:hypothetical protein